MKTIAIIPARSGSKGLKDKNIKPLAGKPMLAYTIEAAQNSGVFDEIMVSTDSAEYAEIAKKFGAQVPFLRGADTSTDTATSWEVVKEVLDKYKKLGHVFDGVCLLQPTSPLRTAGDIRGANQLFQKAEVAVVSVCEVDHSPLWCNHLPDNNSLNGFILRENNRQRQKHGKYYRINGAIYFVNVSELYNDPFLYRDGCYAYIMCREHSIDIDSELDFKIASAILSEISDSI